MYVKLSVFAGQHEIQEVVQKKTNGGRTGSSFSGGTQGPICPDGGRVG